MIEITVGQVSGLIALGTTILQIWIPTVIILILVGTLRDRNTASTWSITGRAIQSSWWPFLMRSDTATGGGLPGGVRFLTILLSLSLGLIALTGIITPLGLHDVMGVGKIQDMPFKYVKDNSPFGYGTPERSNLPFNRVCGYFMPVVCPGSNTVIIDRKDNELDLPYGYNSSLPDELYKIYSSGTGGRGTTVSNFFDIQWRQYSVQQSSDINNGSQYLTGAFRQLNTIILDNSTDLVEGLVVDMNNTQIGLRNHTLPTGFRHGATWSEDLLFVEPETQCISNNISIDFTVASSSVGGAQFGPTALSATNITIVDRGGFAELIQDYPDGYWSDAQNDPTLRDRAYKAAWITNAGAMLYFNLTNPSPNAFAWMKSRVGDEYPLYGLAALNQFQGLRTSSDFHFITNTSTLLRGQNATKYANPNDIDAKYFSSADILCSGAGGQDRANITNIAVACGAVFGAAKRTDGVASAIFEQGTRWSVPIYSCASTAKASIKNVKMEAIGPGLGNANVLNITAKVYNDDSPPPLWGVEHLELNLSDTKPIWGLVSSDYENRPGISTVRKPHLYLPGTDTLDIENLSPENLPGTSFHAAALRRSYSVGTLINDDMADYSGRTNVALFTRLQQLSQSADDAAHIINMFFTDITTNLVVGTRSRLGSPADADYVDSQDDWIDVAVAPMVRQVHFQYPYGVPAFATLVLAALVTLTVLCFACVGRVTFARLRHFLSRSSTGRILATGVHPDYSNLDMRTDDWVRSAGRKYIDLSGSIPTEDTESVALTSRLRPGKT